MAVYLLTYDLRNESGSHDYEPLWAEIKRLGGHRTQDSVWLLEVSNTAKELIEHFRSFVDGDDRLWAASVRRGEYHYVNAKSGTNKWLAANPPD